MLSLDRSLLASALVICGSPAYLVAAEGPQEARPAAEIEAGGSAAIRDELAAWADVVQEEPDAEIVVDPLHRERIASSGLPWHVACRTTGIHLYLVPPGKFERGAPLDDPEAAFEFEKVFPWKRQVDVEVSFYLGVTEVTCDAWGRIMGTIPDYVAESGLEPVEAPLVSTSLEDFEPFLQRTGFSLPRDSDWEYACRADSGAEQVASLEQYARVRSNVDVWETNGPPIVPVGTRRPNAWGFHDMLGNVKEPTSTVFDPFWTGPAEGLPYDSRLDDDRGDPSYTDYTKRFGRRFTNRGGSHGAAEGLATPWYVGSVRPPVGHVTYGFRVAWYPESVRPEVQFGTEQGD